MAYFTEKQLKRDSYDGKLPQTAGEVAMYAGNSGSLAAKIISSFGIEIKVDKDSPLLGGYAPGYDIKLQDAYSMIRLSLVYGLKTGSLWEVYINEYGKAEFITVGHLKGFQGSLGTIYLAISSINHTLMTEKVLLTGYKPAQIRTLGAPQTLAHLARNTGVRTHWSITGNVTMYSDGGTGYSIPNGHLKKTGEGWIRIGDVDWSDSDALNNIYDVGRYESITGYAYAAIVPLGYSFKDDVISMSYQTSSPRFDSIDSSSLAGENFMSAWDIPQTPDSGEVEGFKGINIPGSSEDTFAGVQNVYTYGYPVEHSLVEYNEGKAYALVSETKIHGNTLESLSRGSEYIIIKESNSASLLFANYVSSDFNELYTGDLPLYERRINYEDGFYYYSARVGASLFPKGEGEKGIALDRVVIASTHNIGAISVKDSSGQLTASDLNSFNIKAAAIIIRDEPAPVVFAQGTSCKTLDQVPHFNHAKDAWITEVQEELESMESGDIQITFPFFSEQELCSVASSILSIAKQGRVKLTDGYSGYQEIILTCSPDAQPRLGQLVSAGTIEGINFNTYVNEINYSYQDSSQYTLNVTLGSKWTGSAFGSGWSDSMNQVKVTNVTKEGIVVAAGGDNVTFAVSVGGLGVISCANTTSPGTIISDGDAVKVTINNVPQGEA